MDFVRIGLALLALALAAPSFSQSQNLAPGFSALPKGAKVVIMPTDIELFEISGGGVAEPKADWTEAASRYVLADLEKKEQALGLQTTELTEAQADETAELNSLHGAVARAIDLHHFGPLKLPTKEGKLDWSLGKAAQRIKVMTGADYALFSWVRDSYASSARKAMMVGLAMFGIVSGGSTQVGYASLVDLNSGRVVWFNRLFRGTGDLREAQAAAETVDTLLKDFPAAR